MREYSWGDLIEVLETDGFVINEEVTEALIDLLERGKKFEAEKGHWTKQKPTKPGLYKALIGHVLYVGGLAPVLLEVREDLKGWYALISGAEGVVWEITNTRIKWWWSEPEELPEPPKEE